MKKFATSYPVLLGALIGLFVCAAILVTVMWLPNLGDYLAVHKRFVQALWFTLAFYVVLLNRLWRWRERAASAFWTSMVLLLLTHALAVYFYSTLVRPILVWQWAIIIAVEAFLAVTLVRWSTTRFGRSARGSEEP